MCIPWSRTRMGESHVTNSESIESAQNTEGISNGVTTFNSDQTGNFTRFKDVLNFYM
jgi:hypothetical protein